MDKKEFNKKVELQYKRLKKVLDELDDICSELDCLKDRVQGIVDTYKMV